MAIPRFSTLISTRKFHEHQSKQENIDSGKIIQAETFGQITNDTFNYSSEAPKENVPYIFGAGSVSDLRKAWPEGNWRSAINSNK